MQQPDQIPEQVKAGIERYNQRHEGANVTLEELVWYGTMGCYGFTRNGMFHGVELDGHIHT